MQERAEAQILALLLTQQLREDQMPGSYTDSPVEIPSIMGQDAFVGTMSEAIQAILDAYDSGDMEWAKDAADHLNNIHDGEWPFPY